MLRFHVSRYHGAAVSLRTGAQMAWDRCSHCAAGSEAAVSPQSRAKKHQGSKAKPPVVHGIPGFCGDGSEWFYSTLC